MPRPANLPVIDWNAVANSGLDWSAWLDAAEDPAQATRMKERFDTLDVPAEANALLLNVTRPVNIVAIAEDWCGDVVRHAPVMARIAAASPHINLRFITRAAYPDVFVRFLTNGGEAIPKFVFLSADWVECGNWGPMQADCREIISRGKACNDVASARKLVSQIYQDDPAAQQAFVELAALAELASTPRVEVADPQA